MTALERQLMTLFGSLAPGDRHTLLAFAEFLAARGGAVPAPVVPEKTVQEPEHIPRPEQETIVAGLKRLSKTYPMLDKGEMLGATSDLVATHIMRGTDAGLVIDELEEIFASHYRQLNSGGGDE